jgi:hypothetical protein
MAIQELIAVVPPPTSPLEAGPREKWDAVQSHLGTKLPLDLLEFGLTYGTGKFAGQGIWVFNPFAAVYLQEIEETLSIWRSLKEGEGEQEVPFSVFPDMPRLFPWAADEGGAGLFWLIDGDPQEWPIVVRGHEETKYDQFEMEMTTFLAKIMTMEIVLPHIWLKRSFEDPSRRVFQPLELRPKDRGDFKNIYQLYADNGNKAGFWVQHENWEGVGTIVHVKSIDGKREGQLSSEVTQSEAARVLVDVFEKGSLYKENALLTNAASKGFRLVEGIV